MSKFAFVMLVTAAVVSVQGQNRNLEAAAQAGKWDEFNRLVAQNSGFGPWHVPPPQDIRTLKPVPGAKVYGQSVSAFKSSTTVNGRRTEYSAAHKVTNNNGKVVEVDFKP